MIEAQKSNKQTNKQRVDNAGSRTGTNFVSGRKATDFVFYFTSKTSRNCPFMSTPRKPDLLFFFRRNMDKDEPNASCRQRQRIRKTRWMS